MKAGPAVRLAQLAVLAGVVVALDKGQQRATTLVATRPKFLRVLVDFPDGSTCGCRCSSSAPG
ncbi:hypothetical protein ACQEVB_37590 [Pseudonocardia sp. CA-107938]|uniref:hypothetical protein n=1 Tax=Pseudonocardia sp. CA-107938 TaxID=3240021 RepID=UPI003D8F69F8